MKVWKCVLLGIVFLILNLIGFQKFVLADYHSVREYHPFYDFDTPADFFYGNQWGLRNVGNGETEHLRIDIGMDEVWRVLKGGQRETIVAVIDTGVDMEHEDLKEIFWTNPNEIPENGIDDDENGFIDDIHGWNFYDNNAILYQNEYDKHSTHVTGIIAANRNQIGITGIAGGSKVKIMVLKVLGGKEEAGYTYAIANAIRYAERNGASICNLSFGTANSDRNLTDAISNSSMLFITAAGNGSIGSFGYNIDTRPVYPASYHYENILTVANLTEKGVLNRTSNFGINSVDLAAPGTRILSTIDWSTYKKNQSTEPYGYMSGTSMAVPMVTGVAALLYSEFPELSLPEIKEAILGGTMPLASLGGKVATGGMLRADGAIRYVNDILLPRIKEREEKKQAELEAEQEEKIEKESENKESGNHLPVIKLFKSKKGKLKLNVQDKDLDLKKVRIAIGKRGKSYFKQGKRGVNIPFKKTVKKGLSLKKGKTYTIYAIDKKGNQVIKVIRLKK